MIILLLNHTMYIQADTLWTNLINTVAFRNKGFSMIAPFYGQDLLGGPHSGCGYEPIDDWNKLRNNKGEGLLIGVEQFDSVPHGPPVPLHPVLLV
jgi:hypothetical protein